MNNVIYVITGNTIWILLLLLNILSLTALNNCLKKRRISKAVQMRQLITNFAVIVTTQLVFSATSTFN